MEESSLKTKRSARNGENFCSEILAFTLNVQLGNPVGIEVKNIIIPVVSQRIDIIDIKLLPVVGSGLSGRAASRRPGRTCGRSAALALSRLTGLSCSCCSGKASVGGFSVLAAGWEFSAACETSELSGTGRTAIFRRVFSRKEVAAALYGRKGQGCPR